MSAECVASNLFQTSPGKDDNRLTLILCSFYTASRASFFWNQGFLFFLEAACEALVDCQGSSLAQNDRWLRGPGCKVIAGGEGSQNEHSEPSFRFSFGPNELGTTCEHDTRWHRRVKTAVTPSTEAEWRVALIVYFPKTFFFWRLY